MDSLSQSEGTYDVFLSFRGPDARGNIVSHLFEALTQRGIQTFLDSENLEKGERISPALEGAIEKSRIAVILFSEDYASSAWCLNEVVRIMERHETNSISVLPVFYKVEPREVRGGRNSYEKAFVEHEKKYGKDSKLVKKWKKALHDAGTLSGWDFKDGNEADLKNSIVEEISTQLNRLPLNVAMHPVGINSRVDELNLMLNMQSESGVHDKSLIIGLWAMGGMGKTTLAKALYNSIFRKFQGSAFLESISETSKDPKYMVSLQKDLLYQILMREVTVNSVAAGISLIRKRLSWKRVLIILDGVETLHQIENLAGHLGWFGDGSRIIVTTRNKDLLRRIGALTYEVTALEACDAVDLFEKCISEDRSRKIKRDQVDKALKYTQCLPFALKVLGSVLRANSDWESELDAFARSGHPEINVELKKSYNELDNTDKDIFLHIACFFNEWSRNYVEGVLGSCYHGAARMVDNLIQRSLIRDENGTLKVHVLIELMAKGIVDQNCHENPATRSRIWRHEELVDVLSRDKGRDAAVTAIVLALPNPETIDIDPIAFANLKMLRFLIMINVDTSFDGPICLPNELRWFEWQDCRASGLKFTSIPKKLAVLSVRKSICKEQGKP